MDSARRRGCQFRANTAHASSGGNTVNSSAEEGMFGR
jgi:hypothetical protein